MTETIQKQKNKAYDELAESFDYTNEQAVPEIEKVVITSGIGSITDPDKIQIVQDRLAQICGQQPVPTQATESIASFNVRAGDVVGYKVTLRGNRQQAFLNKLIHITLPRTKDFRGIDPESIDEMGNLTIGIEEHTAFPETSDEELENVFGLSVTIVTTAETRDEAYAYLDHIGIPFADEDDEENAEN
jgi:large subunit ribosomal protein L5